MHILNASILVAAVLFLAGCSQDTSGDLSSGPTPAELMKLESDAQGNAKLQYQLGNMYFTGEGAPLDKNRAVELFTEAASQNFDNAQYTLGYLYETGNSLPQDQTKAADFFLKAAMQGHEESQYRIGQFYANGIGVQKDLIKAVAFLRLVSNIDTRAAELLDSLQKNMTPEENLRAEKYYNDLYKVTEPLRLENESFN